MTDRQVLLRWAPTDAIWSRWVKGVPFAYLLEAAPARAIEVPRWVHARLLPPPVDDAPGHGPYRDTTHSVHDLAVIVDLPGAEGTQVGIGLARLGLRPVPLYNAVPDTVAVVDLRRLLAALRDGAEVLPELPADAPPAFLLDAGRRGSRGPFSGEFDNRSMVSVYDFPSADFVWQTGIRRVLLLQGTAKPAADVAPILRAWQKRGVRMWRAAPGATACEPFRVPFFAPWAPLQRFALRVGLRKRPDGAFGGVVPWPTSG